MDAISAKKSLTYEAENSSGTVQDEDGKINFPNNLSNMQEKIKISK